MHLNNNKSFQLIIYQFEPHTYVSIYFIKVLLTASTRHVQSYLVFDNSADAHAVEDGDIDDGGHAPVVDRLRAVRPHVRTFRKVDVTGAQTEKDERQILSTATSMHIS